MKLLSELSESRLYPSASKLDREDFHGLTEAAHLIFITLRILLAEGSTQDWAEAYVKKTLRGDFHHWRADATDLYVTLYALSTGNYYEGSYHTFTLSPFTRWLREVKSYSSADEGITRTLFARLDSLLSIRDSSQKAVRRLVMDWPDLNNHERRLAVTRLLQMLRARAPKAELLQKLESIARTKGYELHDVCDKETGDCGGSGDHHSGSAKPKSKFSLLPSLLGAGAGYAAMRALGRLKEDATSGATGAASVATVTTALGADSLGPGFDTKGNKGIYQGKPTVLRRGEAPKEKK